MASEQHLSLYRQYYAARPTPERTPSRWLWYVEILAKTLGVETVIDYGCGVARGLSLSRHLKVYDYDPGVIGFETVPSPQGLVCCIHALEHVEPHTLYDTIAHIESLATRAVLLVVSTKESTKTLPDGSPWHTCVRPVEWWHDYLAVQRGYESLQRQAPGEYAAALVRPITKEKKT